MTSNCERIEQIISSQLSEMEFKKKKLPEMEKDSGCCMVIIWQPTELGLHMHGSGEREDS
jgi:hypothetical protein